MWLLQWDLFFIFSVFALMKWINVPFVTEDRISCEHVPHFYGWCLLWSKHKHTPARSSSKSLPHADCFCLWAIRLNVGHLESWKIKLQVKNTSEKALLRVKWVFACRTAEGIILYISEFIWGSFSLIIRSLRPRSSLTWRQPVCLWLCSFV